MRFFKLETTGDLNDETLCFLEDTPEGMGIQDYRMALGVPAGEFYPQDARITLRAENPGIRIPSLIGNDNSYLIATKDLQNVISEFCKDIEIEYLPFTLYNHKNRIHSSECAIINPIGTYDCLNLEASDVMYDSDGKITRINRFVLDETKIVQAPHLFRIKEAPTEYVISFDLGKEIHENGCSNILLVELEVRPTS